MGGERRGGSMSNGEVAKRRRRVSIMDVAAVAGVSRQTVSNVLNGRDEYYSEATHAKVTEAMRSLGYQPNRAAQTMRSQRTMQIGYHIFGDQLESVQGFTLHFVQSLVKAAAEADNHVLVFTNHRDDPLRVFKDLVARRTVDAVIISESHVDDDRAKFLADSGMPFACFGRLAPELPQHWVDVDNVAGIRAVADMLVAKGHTRFAYLGAGGDQYWKLERLAGFKAALAAHDLRLPRSAVYRGSDQGIRRQTRRLLTSPTPPSAIVTGSDAVAAVVVNVVHSLGLTVGEDVAVTGFDGGALGLVTEPVLTSARIPVERISRELVTHCLRQVEGTSDEALGLLVPTELVLGGSA